jgi:phosphate transport system protein
MEQSDLNHHISRQFNEDLSALRHRVLHMGGLVERQVDRAMRALTRGDAALAEAVMAEDDHVDRLEVALDEECRRILALRQPAASDLRLVVATIKMVTDLERVGDEARKIGECALRLSSHDREGAAFDRMPGLGRHVGAMLSGVLDAFARLDAHRALEVARLDRMVDSDYQFVLRSASATMMEHPDQVPVFLDLIWAGRSLERIGDHARNICEYVVFMVHGKDVRHATLEDIDFTLGHGGARRTDDPQVSGASPA